MSFKRVWRKKSWSRPYTLYGGSLHQNSSPQCTFLNCTDYSWIPQCSQKRWCRNVMEVMVPLLFPPSLRAPSPINRPGVFPAIYGIESPWIPKILSLLPTFKSCFSFATAKWLFWVTHLLLFWKVKYNTFYLYGVLIRITKKFLKICKSGWIKNINSSLIPPVPTFKKVSGFFTFVNWMYIAKYMFILLSCSLIFSWSKWWEWIISSMKIFIGTIKGFQIGHDCV